MTDLPADAWYRAAEDVDAAMTNVTHDHGEMLFAMVKAVVSVLAPEIARPLQARLTRAEDDRDKLLEDGLNLITERDALKEQLDQSRKVYAEFVTGQHEEALARITELEARQTMLWRCSSCGTHNTELMADSLRGQLDAENRELAVLTRVELLTAALTDAIEALGWASDYVAVPWPKAYQVEPLRAALAAEATESEAP